MVARQEQWAEYDRVMRDVQAFRSTYEHNLATMTAVDFDKQVATPVQDWTLPGMTAEQGTDQVYDIDAKIRKLPIWCRRKDELIEQLLPYHSFMREYRMFTRTDGDEEQTFARKAYERGAKVLQAVVAFRKALAAFDGIDELDYDAAQQAYKQASETPGMPRDKMISDVCDAAKMPKQVAGFDPEAYERMRNGIVHSVIHMFREDFTLKRMAITKGSEPFYFAHDMEYPPYDAESPKFPASYKSADK